MSDSVSTLPIIITFIIYGLVIMAIASLATRLNKNLSDFVLAGRKLSGPIAALSAGASDMSSWLLMALPGIVYVNGLNKIWMPVALLIGAFLNWSIVAKPLRIYTHIANNSLTIPSYFANRFNDTGCGLRLVTAIAILIFFTLYSVAGFVSGAILLEMTFDINYFSALFLSASVIIAYTTVGGFLAVSWVDFFQGVLMFVALLIVPCVTISHLGGLETVVTSIAEINPNYLNIFDNITIIGIISLLAWGMGYFGQPHIIVRFMALKSTKSVPVARFICITWMATALIGAILTGFVGISYYQNMTLNQPETVFIHLSKILFNPWVSGILLSAVLSSIMSTVSALILMSATAIVEDIYHGILRKNASDLECIWANRLGILLISMIAVWLSADPNTTILEAVAFAWCGLGASFGPVILFSLYWRRMTKEGAIAGIITGMVVVLAWDFLAHQVGGIFKHPDILPGFVLLPAFVLSSVAIIITSLKTNEPDLYITEMFDKTKKGDIGEMLSCS